MYILVGMVYASTDQCRGYCIYNASNVEKFQQSTLLVNSVYPLHVGKVNPRKFASSKLQCYLSSHTIM